MARQLHKLNARKVETASNAGRYGDGGGLYLRVKPSGSKSWSFLWKQSGQPIELAIGPYPAIGLALAREQAANWRTLVATGGDPRQEKRQATKIPTFSEVVGEYLETMEGQWSNPKHRLQWRNTLGDYCLPIANLPVSEIRLDDVLRCLKPIWNEKPETASRLRGRMERVLSYAQTKGWRSDVNPAVWRGNLQNVLPKPAKLTRGHHAAMDWRDVPAFMERLAQSDALAARALELLIYTTCRSGEVLNARWSEIDLEARVWEIPAQRMKARKAHRVPLTDAAMAVLSPLTETRTSELVFPGQATGKPLSGMAMAMLLRRLKKPEITVHGFRSAFRDWAGDQTSFPREIAEGCLAHVVGSATERAYRRGDGLDKRRQLLAAWENYLAGKNTAQILRFAQDK